MRVSRPIQRGADEECPESLEQLAGRPTQHDSTLFHLLYVFSPSDQNGLRALRRAPLKSGPALTKTCVAYIDDACASDLSAL